MRDLQEMVILGIKEAAPRSQNFVKAFEGQEKDETPSAFLKRLKEATRKYSGMDPDNPIAKELLKVQFVTKSWPDIQKKLQKLDGWNERQMEELLCESQKVYVKREDEKQKQKAKMMVAAVEEITKRRMGSRKTRGGHERQGSNTRERRQQAQKVIAFPRAAHHAFVFYACAHIDRCFHAQGTMPVCSAHAEITGSKNGIPRHCILIATPTHPHYWLKLRRAWML
ncbi:hypothetical protein chiPu_0004022 [Chiloscyllium punctatum]|uniref:Core shell protein Gag P30 domain-containing protein n=1 Tax=Chiloscyllium punctatum TaxID=137246 RepID=A0A401S5D3_CHIPU|nr:hypothetical protein [Chiloscyllium punctatum]